MNMMPFALALALVALSGPALAKDTCNPGGGDPCKVGDCLGGDVLGRDGVWHSSKGCALSAAPSGTLGASRLSPGATTGGTAGGEPASISDQAAAGNLTSFLPTAQSDSPCRAPMPGVLLPAANGCRIPVGQEQWCRAGGGLLAESGGKRFCLPQGVAGAR